MLNQAKLFINPKTLEQWLVLSSHLTDRKGWIINNNFYKLTMIQEYSIFNSERKN